MELDIKNMQNLWKEEKSKPLDLGQLIKHLNTIERKGKSERIVLLISLPITILLLATLLPILSNLYYLIAVALIGLGMLMILIQVYRSKHTLVSNGAELNNNKFIKTLIDKLNQRMLITSRYMWFYTFLLILGLNIGYFDILQNFKLSILARVITHIIITVVMFYIMYYAINKRKKKNDHELLPLIDLLKNLK